MSDGLPQLYWCRNPRGEKRGTGLLGLAAVGDTGETVEMVRLRWSRTAAARLRELARQAREGGTEQGRALPYASLRAVLQVRVPEAMRIDDDLGAPWNGSGGEDRRRWFADCSGSGGGDAVVRRACAAYATWSTMVVARWAERVGASGDLLEALAAEAAAGTLIEAEPQTVDRGAVPPDQARRPLLQIAAERLQGQELFEGLGPVYRVVRSSAASNELVLQTWPKIYGDACYSMTATLAVETMPYTEIPVLTVRAGKRRWLRELADAARLRRFRSLSGYLMSRDAAAPIAVAVRLPVQRGEPQFGIDPAFMTQALLVDADLGADVRTAVARSSAAARAFFGVPHSPQRDGGHPVGSGAATRDHNDLFGAVAARLADAGFAPLGAQRILRPPTRSAEMHKMVEAAGMAAEIAEALAAGGGSGDLGETLAMLMADGPAKEIDPAKAADARTVLQRLRTENRKRIHRAFGNHRPFVAVVAPDEEQRDRLRLCVQALFGDAVAVDGYILPPGAHGPRSALPASDGRAAERFGARLAAWTPLAETLRAEHPSAHVVVQAPDWYPGGKDDGVNKGAGRRALAETGGANVQYLLPPGRGWSGFQNYVHRLQSAVYDLLFGHAGLVTDVGTLVRDAFPDEDTRPKSIVGFSVVTQARLRSGAGGGKIAVATRVDVASSRTFGRVCWWNGARNEACWSDWEPMFDLLKRIAGLDADLGGDAETERQCVGSFVEETLDELCSGGARPLALVDATSAEQLLPWLSDRSISGGAVLADGRRPAERWPSARIVRVRQGRSPRIVEVRRKLMYPVGNDGQPDTEKEFALEYPTITETAVLVAEPEGGRGGHYVVTPPYMEQGIRGQSAYRTITVYRNASEAEVPEGRSKARMLVAMARSIEGDPYRVPRTIEVTVVTCHADDAPDALAGVVASLRYGYGHTAAMTALPAPLSFEAKVRDYMSRFVVADADAEDDDPGNAEDDESDPPDGPDGPGTPDGGGAEDAGGAPDGGPLVSAAEADGHGRVGTGPEDGTSERGGERDMSTTAETETGADRRIDPPSFVTPEWLEDKIVLGDAELARLHAARRRITAMSGFSGWPEEQPDNDGFRRMAVEGFRHPLFVMACNVVLNERSNGSIDLSPQCSTLFDGYKRGRKLRSLELVTKRLRRGQSGMVEALGKLKKAAEAAEYAFMVGTSATQAKEMLDEVARIRAADRAQELDEVVRYLKEVRRLVALRFDLHHLEGHRLAFGKLMQMLREEDGTVRPPNGGDVSGAEPGTAAVPATTVEGIARDGADRHADGVADHGAAASADAPVAGDAGAGASAPAPAPASPSERALRDWQEALSDTQFALNVLSASSPNADAVTAVIAALERARAAADAWRESLPKGVEAAALARRLEELAAAMDDPQKIDVDVVRSGLGGINHVIEEAAARATEACDEAQRHVEEARRLADEADRINLAIASGQLPKSERALRSAIMQELWQKSSDKDAQAADCIMTAVRLLVEGQIADGPPPDGRAAASTLSLPEPKSTTDAATGGGGAAEADAGVPERAAPEEADVAEAESDPAARGVFPMPEADGGERDAFAPAALDDLLPDAGEPENEVAPDGPEPTSADEPVAADPLAFQLDERVVELFGAGEFGLACHLVSAAAEAVPDYRPPLSAPELRFLAEAGHINYADAAADPDVLAVIDSAYDAAQSIPDDGSDLSVARRLVLSAAALEAALFMPSTNAEQILRVADTEEFGSHLYAVRKAVLDTVHRGIPVTLPMMRALAAEAKNDDAAERLRREIIQTIDSKPTELRFLFMLGVKVVNRIFRDSDVSRLRNGLDGSNALEAAREFAASYGARSDIHGLIDAVSEEIDPQDRIVGAARDKLTRAIEDIVGKCRSFIAMREAQPAVEGQRQRAELLKVREDVLKGVERAVGGLERATVSGVLLEAAVRYAVRTLRHLGDALTGKVDLPGTTDRLVAVHGALMWLPGLRFADSWLPSPYDSNVVIQSICSAPLPVVRSGDPEALRAVVASRLDEHSYVPARTLADAAPFYGVAETEATAVRDEIDANEQMCRHQIRPAIERAKRQVSVAQRLGLGSGELDLLYDRLLSVQPDELSVRASLATLSEERHGERVLDFSSVYDLISEIEREVERLTRPKRAELCRALDDLGDRVDPKDAAEVRAQIESRNLMEGEELLGLLKENGRLPSSRRVNRAFAEYFPAVPDWMDAKSGQIGGDALAEAIRRGEQVGPLNFGRVLGRLREHAAATWEAWLDLKSRMERGLTDEVFSAAASLIGRLGLQMTVTPGAPAKAPIKFRMGEAEVQVDDDGTNLLLPEFGGLSGGVYRICLIASEVTESDVERMCGLGREPLLVVVGGPVSRARRAQIALVSCRKARPVLLLDESLVLYALTEREPRRMVLFECAQPFSWAEPYKDYDRDPVPPEVFVGRSRFLNRIRDSHGGFIVFGGRRLGKTALLQRSQGMYHRPDEGHLCAFVDIQSIGRPGDAVKPSALWSIVSSNERLAKVFPKPVATAEEFAAAVKRWLGGGRQRGILLLLDEAERFVEADAAGADGQPAFSVFLALQRLMNDTEKRFKFVLSGLHNVARVIRAQNSPLKHIAQDAIRVGPLVEEDRSEAERLLTHPLAALGFEFKERIDVWRILTKANYYPVLIHVFCQMLLRKLQSDWLAKGRIPEDRSIPSEMVSEMLEDRKLSDGLQRIFDLTIDGCDPRYAIITCAAAHKWYSDMASGIPHEGVSPLEVRDVAATYWPKVFDGPHGLALIEDLMDEMETLGVLQNVERKRWKLRSKMILDYIGSREEVRAKLQAFRTRDEPDTFDVRSVRREMTVPALPGRDQRAVLSPLTVGQEYDILSGRTPVRILFGNGLSDVGLVGFALRDARSGSEQDSADVVAGKWHKAADLAADVAKYRRDEGVPGLFVVDASTAWDVSWIDAVLDLRAVRDGRVRVVFVGDAEHAWRWAVHPATANPIEDVRVEPLSLWTRRSISGWLKDLELRGDKLADSVIAATGGFHRPTAELLRGMPGRRNEAAEKHVAAFLASLMKDARLPETLGIASGPVGESLRAALPFADPVNRCISAYELDELVLDDALRAQGASGAVVVRYGVAMGLMAYAPVPVEVPEEERLYVLNPLADAVLKTMAAKGGVQERAQKKKEGVKA